MWAFLGPVLGVAVVRPIVFITYNVLLIIDQYNIPCYHNDTNSQNHLE